MSQDFKWPNVAEKSVRTQVWMSQNLNVAEIENDAEKLRNSPSLNVGLRMSQILKLIKCRRNFWTTSQISTNGKCRKIYLTCKCRKTHLNQSLTSEQIAQDLKILKMSQNMNVAQLEYQLYPEVFNNPSCFNPNLQFPTDLPKTIQPQLASSVYKHF